MLVKTKEKKTSVLTAEHDTHFPSCEVLGFSS